MDVVMHPGARQELSALRAQSVAEHTAMLRAMRKLELFGLRLGYPWTSHIEATDLWELRPLAGRSSWRAIYRRIGDQFVIGAVGPDAKVNRRHFDAAKRRATERLP